VISGTQMAMPGSKVNVRQGRIQPSGPAAKAPVISAPVTGEATVAR
jgi:hypothetical protein